MTSDVASPPLREDTPLVDGPYRGLLPYSERDTAYFFGRGAERELITANLIAARLTIFYGASGVGKSSILAAGAVHDLRELATSSLAAGRGPEYVPVLARRWSGDWRLELDRRLAAAVGATLGAEAPDPPAAGLDLAEHLGAWTAATDATLLLILDQFEEFLLYHGSSWEPGSPARELARALSRRDLRAHFLISIREDALSQLDAFKGRVPRLFDNLLRLSHLDVRGARSAILGPVAAWTKATGERVDVEPALVDALVAQAGAGRIALAHAGRGGLAGDQAGGIEAPFLQLVLTRLWEAEPAAPVRRLRLSTLDRLGGAEAIVRTHLVHRLEALPPDEQDVAAAAFHHLVTPSGTKVAHSVADLAAYAGIPATALQPVLEKLSSGDWRIVRPVSEPGRPDDAPAYEIFHDVLAGAILEWRARHVEERATRAALERERAAARRRRRRRLRRALLAAGTVVLAVMTTLAVIALKQSSDARSQRRLADSRALAAAARGQLAIDPELSVVLAARALRDGRTSNEAVGALRAALAASPLLGVLPGRDGVLLTHVALSPRGDRVATGDRKGTVRIWDPTRPDRTLRELDAGALVRSLTFSPDGRELYAGTESGGARGWEVASGEQRAAIARGTAVWAPGGARVLTWTGHGAARVADPVARRSVRLRAARVANGAFSADGRRVVTAGVDGTAALWDARTGAPLRRFPGVRTSGDAIAVTRDGRASVVAGDGGAWLLHGTDRPQRLDAGHRVSAADVSPDGRLVATAGEDSRLRIWNGATGKLENVLAGHGGQILAARFSPDGRTVATAGLDRTVRLWDPRGATVLSVERGHRGLVTDLEFGSERLRGRIVSVSADSDARIWSLGATPRRTLRQPGAISTATFDRTGRRVVTAGDDGARVSAWQRASDAPVTTIRKGVRLYTGDLSPDGRRLVTTPFTPGPAQLFDVRTGASLGPRPSGRRGANGAAFSPDGSAIVTAGQDGVVRLSAARDGRLLAQRRLGRPLSDAQFSADGRLIIVVGEDATGAVLDAQRLHLRTRLADPVAGPNYTVGFITGALGGGFAAAAGDDGVGRLWRLADGSRPDVIIHGASVTSVAFSADGRIVATASLDGTVRLWETATAQQLEIIDRRSKPVDSVAFSPDGRWLLTAADDGEMRIFPCELCRGRSALLALAARRPPRVLTPAERRVYHLPNGSSP